MGSELNNRSQAYTLISVEPAVPPPPQTSYRPHSPAGIPLQVVRNTLPMGANCYDTESDNLAIASIASNGPRTGP